MHSTLSPSQMLHDNELVQNRTTTKLIERQNAESKFEVEILPNANISINILNNDDLKRTKPFKRLKAKPYVNNALKVSNSEFLTPAAHP